MATKKKQQADVMDAGEFDEFDPYAPSIEDQIETLDEKRKAEAYAELDRRKLAYSRVFAGKGEKADVETVMQDLAWFGRLFGSAFRPDAREHALLEGRREVVQRIMDFTRLDRDALFKKYTGSR